MSGASPREHACGRRGASCAHRRVVQRCGREKRHVMREHVGPVTDRHVAQHFGVKGSARLTIGDAEWLAWNRSRPTIETAAARRLSRTPSTAKRRGSNGLCVRDVLSAPACMLDSSGRGRPHTPTPPPVLDICVGGLCGEARRARWECQQGLVSRASVRRRTANAREPQRYSGDEALSLHWAGLAPPARGCESLG